MGLDVKWKDVGVGRKAYNLDGVGGLGIIRKCRVSWVIRE